ncbi:hypothetical protein JBE27_31665, partial [Streptomyces albiflaviniger]|nr:hypothetical protein [Streptomyces albiflaviniger]
MTSVVFVHGTGVRAKSYEKSFARVLSGLGRVRADVQVARCFWGEEHGAALGLGGASLPVRTKNRGVGGDGALDEDDPLAVWALLEVDPLAELREFVQAAHDGGEETGFAPGRVDPWETVADTVRGLTLADTGQTGGGLPRLVADLAPHLDEAAGRVADEISGSLGGSSPADGIEPIAARAVYA